MKRPKRIPQSADECEKENIRQSVRLFKVMRAKCTAFIQRFSGLLWNVIQQRHLQSGKLLHWMVSFLNLFDVVVNDMLTADLWAQSIFFISCVVCKLPENALGQGQMKDKRFYLFKYEKKIDKVFHFISSNLIFLNNLCTSTAQSTDQVYWLFVKQSSC